MSAMWTRLGSPPPASLAWAPGPPRLLRRFLRGALPPRLIALGRRPIAISPRLIVLGRRLGAFYRAARSRGLSPSPALAGEEAPRPPSSPRASPRDPSALPPSSASRP